MFYRLFGVKGRGQGISRFSLPFHRRILSFKILFLMLIMLICSSAAISSTSFWSSRSDVGSRLVTKSEVYATLTRPFFVSNLGDEYVYSGCIRTTQTLSDDFVIEKSDSRLHAGACIDYCNSLRFPVAALSSGSVCYCDYSLRDLSSSAMFAKNSPSLETTSYSDVRFVNSTFSGSFIAEPERHCNIPCPGLLKNVDKCGGEEGYMNIYVSTEFINPYTLLPQPGRELITSFPDPSLSADTRSRSLLGTVILFDLSAYETVITRENEVQNRKETDTNSTSFSNGYHYDATDSDDSIVTEQMLLDELTLTIRSTVFHYVDKNTKNVNNVYNTTAVYSPSNLMFMSSLEGFPTYTALGLRSAIYSSTSTLRSSNHGLRNFHFLTKSCVDVLTIVLYGGSADLDITPVLNVIHGLLEFVNIPNTNLFYRQDEEKIPDEFFRQPTNSTKPTFARARIEGHVIRTYLNISPEFDVNTVNTSTSSFAESFPTSLAVSIGFSVNGGHSLADDMLTYNQALIPRAVIHEVTPISQTTMGIPSQLLYSMYQRKQGLFDDSFVNKQTQARNKAEKERNLKNVRGIEKKLDGVKNPAIADAITKYYTEYDLVPNDIPELSSIVGYEAYQRLHHQLSTKMAKMAKEDNITTKTRIKTNHQVELTDESAFLPSSALQLELEVIRDVIIQTTSPLYSLYIFTDERIVDEEYIKTYLQQEDEDDNDNDNEDENKSGGNNDEKNTKKSTILHPYIISHESEKVDEYLTLPQVNQIPFSSFASSEALSSFIPLYGTCPSFRSSLLRKASAKSVGVVGSSYAANKRGKNTNETAKTTKTTKNTKNTKSIDGSLDSLLGSLSSSVSSPLFNARNTVAGPHAGYILPVVQGVSLSENRVVRNSHLDGFSSVLTAFEKDKKKHNEKQLSRSLNLPQVLHSSELVNGPLAHLVFDNDRNEPKPDAIASFSALSLDLDAEKGGNRDEMNRNLDSQNLSPFALRTLHVIRPKSESKHSLIASKTVDNANFSNLPDTSSSPSTSGSEISMITSLVSLQAKLQRVKVRWIPEGKTTVYLRPSTKTPVYYHTMTTSTAQTRATISSIFNRFFTRSKSDEGSAGQDGNDFETNAKGEHFVSSISSLVSVTGRNTPESTSLHQSFFTYANAHSTLASSSLKGISIHKFTYRVAKRYNPKLLRPQVQQESIQNESENKMNNLNGENDIFTQSPYFASSPFNFFQLPIPPSSSRHLYLSLLFQVIPATILSEMTNARVQNILLRASDPDVLSRWKFTLLARRQYGLKVGKPIPSSLNDIDLNGDFPLILALRPAIHGEYRDILRKTYLGLAKTPATNNSSNIAKQKNTSAVTTTTSRLYPKRILLLARILEEEKNFSMAMKAYALLCDVAVDPSHLFEGLVGLASTAMKAVEGDLDILLDLGPRQMPPYSTSQNLAEKLEEMKEVGLEIAEGAGLPENPYVLLSMDEEEEKEEDEDKNIDKDAIEKDRHDDVRDDGHSDGHEHTHTRSAIHPISDISLLDLLSNSMSNIAFRVDNDFSEQKEKKNGRFLDISELPLPSYSPLAPAPAWLLIKSIFLAATEIQPWRPEPSLAIASRLLELPKESIHDIHGNRDPAIMLWSLSSAVSALEISYGAYSMSDRMNSHAHAHTNVHINSNIHDDSYQSSMSLMSLQLLTLTPVVRVMTYDLPKTLALASRRVHRYDLCSQNADLAYKYNRTDSVVLYLRQECGIIYKKTATPTSTPSQVTTLTTSEENGVLTWLQGLDTSMLTSASPFAISASLVSSVSAPSFITALPSDKFLRTFRPSAKMREEWSEEEITEMYRMERQEKRKHAYQRDDDKNENNHEHHHDYETNDVEIDFDLDGMDGDGDTNGFVAGISSLLDYVYDVYESFEPTDKETRRGNKPTSQGATTTTHSHKTLSTKARYYPKESRFYWFYKDSYDGKFAVVVLALALFFFFMSVLRTIVVACYQRRLQGLSQSKIREKYGNARQGREKEDKYGEGDIHGSLVSSPVTRTQRRTMVQEENLGNGENEYDEQHNLTDFYDHNGDDMNDDMNELHESQRHLSSSSAGKNETIERLRQAMMTHADPIPSPIFDNVSEQQSSDILFEDYQEFHLPNVVANIGTTTSLQHLPSPISNPTSTLISPSLQSSSSLPSIPSIDIPAIVSLGLPQLISPQTQPQVQDLVSLPSSTAVLSPLPTFASLRDVPIRSPIVANVPASITNVSTTTGINNNLPNLLSHSMSLGLPHVNKQKNTN